MSSEHEHADSQEGRKQHQPAADATPLPAEGLAADDLPDYPSTLLTDPRLGDRGNQPVRAALLQQGQSTYGNRAVQRFLAARKPPPVQRDGPSGAARPGAFNVDDPFNLRGAAQHVLDQEERDVRQWLNTNTDQLRHYLGSGRAALVFMVKTTAPGATAMPDQQVNRLLDEWARNHQQVIPAISFAGPLPTRTIAAPATNHKSGDDAQHLGIDLAGGGGSYTITAVWRNLNAHDAAEGRFGVDLLHEPNVSVQIQPDPQNPAIFQAAIALLNAHLRAHNQELIEASLGVQGSAGAGGASGAAQAQVELHLSTRVSITASTSVTAQGHSDSPPDPGSVPLGTSGGVDFSWQPISLGTLIHFD